LLLFAIAVWPPCLLRSNHICPDHLKAESFTIKGVPSRFCQRCGISHGLEEFDGRKKSCRKALDKRNQRRWVLETSGCAAYGCCLGGIAGQRWHLLLKLVPLVV